MKYLGTITDDKDLVTKKYVDDAAKVVQTLTSGTEIGSVGGTKLYAPQGGGGGGDMYKSTYDTNNSGVVDNAEALGGVAPSGYLKSSGLFKVVEVSFTQATISAHGYASGTSHSVPTASRPSGMTLVGIVGFRSSIYRLYPYTYYIDGAHSFWMGITNATASSSAEATIRVELLYVKATSA